MATGAVAPVVLSDAMLSPAVAQASGFFDIIAPDAVTQQTILMVALAAAMIFAVVSTVALMRARDRAEAENRHLHDRIVDLQASVDRAEALVSETGRRLVAWRQSGEATHTSGSLPPETGVPVDDETFLSFGLWLADESTDRLLGHIAGLRAQALPFHETLLTRAGYRIDVRGWNTGGTAAVRFRDLTGDRLALAKLREQQDTLAAQVKTMRDMLSAAPLPVWLRDAAGKLTWVNDAYAAAVEADGSESAVANGSELFDGVGRHTIAEIHRRDIIYAGRLPTIVGGSKRVFDVADIAAVDGSAGMAIDVTEAETARAALRREIAFAARTLDQLQTAVVSFGPDHRLRTYNAAYRALFDLDPAFLESAPDESTILERLRAARKLPEQANFRDWREELLQAYESREARESTWHLPDGRSLRVIANPHPGGGMTWIYENVTERLDLEIRYNTLMSVQGETIDHLAEGVAVFGSNGRLRLYNPAFADIWSLDRSLLDGLPHVSDVVAACAKLDSDPELWRQFTASIAGLDETRAGSVGRLRQRDGRVVDYATVPLPDGQTMVTFVDITDSANVEKALIEKNEALQASDRLKNAFIRHVSYELRSPLTNIIGFAQLMTDTRVGPLNEKQDEYVSYILSSSASLLAIINDILDLTTVDAGVMELDISEIGIATLVNETLSELEEQISAKGIQVELALPPGVGRFVADEKRVRQVLFNLIANAIEYSHDGGRITVSVVRRDQQVEFEIRDEGHGMPADFVDVAFDRFSSLPRGNSRGGAGLGLAIVKSFVELHGGMVRIESADGQGSAVHMSLPLRPRVVAAAAE
ncbi:MAG: ATP-binding protein [Alphaproteobacteria bacterium]